MAQPQSNGHSIKPAFKPRHSGSQMCGHHTYFIYDGCFPSDRDPKSLGPCEVWSIVNEECSLTSNLCCAHMAGDWGWLSVISISLLPGAVRLYEMYDCRDLDPGLKGYPGKMGFIHHITRHKPGNQAHPFHCKSAYKSGCVEKLLRFVSESGRAGSALALLATGCREGFG